MRLKSLILLGGVSIATFIASCSVEHFDRETFRARVTGKERVVKGGESKYMIFTQLENGRTRVFEDTDSPLELKFNSSDVYAKLEEGKTYNIRTYGFRIPLFSVYENIIGVEPVNE